MILPTIAKMLVQEHRFRPITGRVLCLGPQLVGMHKGQVDALCAESPEGASRAMALWREAGADMSRVDDKYFFSKFPISQLDSLDVVEGFGGTLIHDLNKPLSEEHHNKFDFILDGGTFDHLVQIGTAFKSVVQMLKPGGRVFHYNAASGYIGAAYVSFGPDLFYDYYVVNRFEDCRIHLLRGTGPHADDPFYVFYLPDARTKKLNSAMHQMVVCLAEKAFDGTSTCDVLPVEYTYRNQDMGEAFTRERVRILKNSKRPMLTCDRPWLSTVRETMKKTKIEVGYAIERWRANKFVWWKFRRDRKLHKAGTSYAYLGRL